MPEAAANEDRPDTPPLESPELYINRELSLLEFNARVLEQAKDPDVPLLERLKFLCISSTNLDEFFEVRVAGVVQKAEMGSATTEADNIAPGDLLQSISRRAHALVDDQYRTLNEELIPELEQAGIRFLRRSEWNESQRRWLAEYFEEELLPVISPLGLDPAHPFPRILNKSLNFIVSLEGKDAFGRNSGYAIVQAPRALPRLIRLPPDKTDSGPHDFVFLSSVIHAHVEDLFPNMRATGCYQFRVTRNSDLFVDEEEVDDLLRAVAGELPSRRYGDAVRLEVAHNCPAHMTEYLLERFMLDADALYQVDGPVNVNRLMAILDLVDRPDLKYPPFTPRLPAALGPGADLFGEIRRGDVLLHHPFDAFLPVIEFVRRAAADPKVLAIKQTLYRTGPDSAVVDALVAAAEAGKEVTVVVELRARFDEADNIALANRLQEAGAHVVYGVVGYKTHAKMTLIVRRENEGLRHYVHLGTGNYHPKTARLYTDYGLFTCDDVVGNDVHELFLQLTSLGKISGLEKLIDAPFQLHKTMLAKIGREAEHARAGRPARLIAKMNALVEPQTIRALYAASQAGVEIDLIVRGICCLRPGVPGVSDNIRVRSIVGRFLEHTRVFYFANDGDAELYLSSADWMDRNFFRRVETCFPVEDESLRARVLRDLDTYLADNCQAWELQSDGTYRHCRPGPDEAPTAAQAALLRAAAE
ncbi:polyphosphate kinase [Salinisphaera sp. PC39]|uniref:polyphosphate kinase 1 n=1 Tax=Salinisphaera sp. PC39 TaxID=1304156 RepID=UPI003340855B